MPSNLDQLVLQHLAKQVSRPIGDIYKLINANRKNADGETLKEVIARLVKVGIITSTTVRNGKRGKPVQQISINTSHKSFK
jgi:predicted transcriptional regulator